MVFILKEGFDYAENAQAPLFTITDNNGDLETFFYGTSNFDYLGIFDGDGDGGADFNGNPTNGFNTYTGFDDNYLAASDIDGSPSTIAPPAFLTWSNLDISQLSSLILSVDVATDDTPGSGGLDPDDFLKFEYSIDGGAFQNLLAFETADATTSNQPTFLEDTDFDGIGDGTALTSTAQTFSKTFAVSGNTLDLRAAIRVEAGFEDIGLDNVILRGNTPMMYVTEYMYSGSSGEFIEFTNTGAAAIDMTGWSFDDDSRTSGTADLSAFGLVQPDESVILTEADAEAFRTAWGLSPTTQIIGGLSANLGRNDEINLYDASGNLVDRLTYGDEDFPGTIRTQNASGWTTAENLGANNITGWTLATPGDAQGSFAATSGDIGNPGSFGTSAPTPGVTVTETGGSTSVVEGGVADTYTIVLKTQPTADVTIAIGNTAQTTTNPTTLTFTTADWNVPQTVTVAAVNDSTPEGSHTGTITHTATSGDANYNGIAIAEVTANITESGFLTKIGGYGSANGAEIPAFDPLSDRLFVVAGSVVEVLDFSDPTNPSKIGDLAFNTDGDPDGDTPDGFELVPNSVAVGKAGTVSEGIVAVAIAITNQTTLDDNPGEVQFFNGADGAYLGKVTVGYLPDMLTFTPDGTKILTANEGQPNDAYTNDPVGSVSVIDLSGGVGAATVQEASFAPFNDQIDSLRAAGVRIFGPGSSVAQDLEPEYIAFNGDGTKAWVTLQENNAIAVVDVASATVESILPLGYKDHNGVSVTNLETFEFGELPTIGTTPAGQDLFLGGFSGLFYEGTNQANGNLKFLTHTDRGPNGEPTGSDRPFLLPDFSPEIVRFELNRSTGEITITERINIKQADGTPITGLPNLLVDGGGGNTPYNDENPVDLNGDPITPLDPFGGDLEGIVVNPTDGTFWMVDEYRPAIYHFATDGTLIDRFVPAGTAAAISQPDGTFGTEALPEVLAQRRQNRGFEAVALNTDTGKLYAFVQSPIRNPETLANSALNNLNNIRIVEFDVATETVTAEYLYPMDNPNLGTSGNTRPDKIGDAVYIGNGEFLVVERDDDAIDSDPLSNIEKKVYRFNLGGATNITGQDAPIDLGGGVFKTVDQMTPEELSSQGINLVNKLLHVDLAQAGYNTVEKVEGLAVIDANTIALLNDNDFQVAGITLNGDGTFTPDPDPEPVVLGLITTEPSNGFDASDRDVDGTSGGGGKINIQNWPVLGMYQPDSIASFTANGQTYYVTANEGDARDYDGFSEEIDLGDITLDPAAFPNAADLVLNQNLGRLTLTSTPGDADGDGDYDRLYAFGARSFSIWDSQGNLVYDSGDDLEQITAELLPANFNSNNNSNNFDNRSDNKGPEPEGVAVGTIGDRTYAFVGLERIGGVMVYEVTNPEKPAFVQYLNPRDFNADPESNATDSGPEGLTFIPASDSPNGDPLLVVANEVSKTVAVYSVDVGTRISDIQGSGDASPLVGQSVSEVPGVVTAIRSNGFYLQDPTPDDNPNTSEGIFVFTSSAPTVAVGDSIKVTGTVAEFQRSGDDFSLTQISSPTITTLSSNNPLPDPIVVNFPLTEVTDLEAVEGMLVVVPDTLYVTEYFNLDRFGEIRLASDGSSNAPGTDPRLDQFTQFNTPDVAGFTAYQAEIAKRQITLDDGSSVQNPNPIIFGRGGQPLSATNTLRGGDTVTNLSGILTYAFDTYRIENTAGVDFQPTNPRPDSPEDVGSRLKVASLNVLNYFTTIDTIQEPSGSPDDPADNTDAGLDPRGADSQEEFDRQTQKLITALSAIDADVFGLVELENSNSDSALANIVTELNAVVGAGTYDYIPSGLVGSDAITVGLIYKAANVTPVGDLAVLDTPAFVDPNNTGEDRNRPALAQTFEEVATGESFTAVVNHFKSKGSSGLTDTNSPDFDRNDGQGFWNDTRTKAAQALLDWLETDPTGSGDPDFLIVGDLNAYAQEDPVQVLVDAGYTDLAQSLIGDGAYSYLFDGQFGTLDYALASPSLTNQVTGVTEWHINADEPDALDYNLDFGRDPSLFDGTTPFRTSDHDPVIVGLDLGASFTLELFHLADQEPLQAGAGIADITRLSGILNALKAQDLGGDGVEDNTVILSSGDAFIPGLFYDASGPVFGSRGIADIQIQNELGIQAISFGNHEFDFGTGVLADLIDGSAPGTILGADFVGANFPYLSTNLDFSTDANLAPLEVAGGQAPLPRTVTSSVVIDVNGEDIGVVGATTPTLASISSPGTVGISPSPFNSNPTNEQLDALAAEIQEEVDALLAANPAMNKVVLLAHMQKIEIEYALAERLTNVDIIVGGGSNTRLFDDNDRIRAGDSDQGQYPQFFTNAGGTQTAVVNTDGSYKYLGRLVLDFDAAGNIIPESYDENISGAYATDAQGVADLNAGGLIDPEIQQIVDAIEAQIIATESNVFGLSDVFLNGNRSGTPVDGVRTQETNLGNLTADANLALAKSIDPAVAISLKNGGGIRASIGQTIVPPGGTEAVRSPNPELVDGQGNVIKPEGGISENDIKTTLAFNNGLTLLTLTKQEVVDLLEHGVSALPSAAGQFPQIAGVKFSFDPDLPADDRILSAGIVDENDNLIAELVREGELVGDANQLFRIVTLNFLAAPRFDDNGNFIGGGDGYPFPNTNTDPNVGEVGDPDVIARVNTVQLTQEGVRTGDATFADDGTEQDALAEYLNDNFSTTPFSEADTTPELDERIQNLNFFATLPNGVASGDTTQTSTVLWANSLAPGAVTFEIFSDPARTNEIASQTVTPATIGQPVKVEFAALNPGTQYYYQVTDAAGTEETGEFQTAAAPGTFAGLTFGVSGDWRGELAPYPAISNAAGKDLDFFVEHGDTIYADVPSPGLLAGDGTEKAQAESIDDYRAKHAEVYGDRFGENFWAELRSSTSILATIDDHEVINDFSGGASADTDSRFPETSGLINDTALYENGLQAFQEYNPLRDEFYGETGDDRTAGERKLYRYNTYGSDAAAIVLDNRSFRDEPLAPADISKPEDVARFLGESATLDRTMLGAVQLEDLKADLLVAQESGVTWKFVMVPEPIQNFGPLGAGDRFEGYGKERTEILKFINDNGIENVVFVAADIHGTVVNNLTYQETVGGEQIATSAWEISTGSVAYDAPFGPTLANLGADLGLLTPEQLAFFNSLPVANDADSVVNDKDDFIKNLIDTSLDDFGYDQIGLNNNLTQAQGLIDAQLLQGDYIAVNTYGWTEFDIDPVTQQLTVTTYGIEPYTRTEIEDPATQVAIIARESQIVSQFTVSAKGIDEEEPSELVAGTPGSDDLVAGIDFDANDIVFTGAGDDSVDGAFGGEDVGSNRIQTGSGKDTTFVADGDRAFGGSGDDVLDATDASGYRLSGGDGNDTFYLGVGGRALGGDGDDKFFVQEGGDNLLSGGAGADEFWILTDDPLLLEGQENVIADYTIGVDAIGIANNLDRDLLTTAGSDILYDGTTVATLIGVNAADATFVFADPFAG